MLRLLRVEPRQLHQPHPEVCLYLSVSSSSQCTDGDVLFLVRNIATVASFYVGFLFARQVKTRLFLYFQTDGIGTLSGATSIPVDNSGQANKHWSFLASHLVISNLSIAAQRLKLRIRTVPSFPRFPNLFNRGVVVYCVINRCWEPGILNLMLLKCFIWNC